MAFGRRSRFSLSAPRWPTFVVSLAVIGVALLSLRFHLPVGHAFVSAHRLLIVVGAYVLLLLGTMLPGI